LVGGESIKVKVSIEIGLRNTRCPGYGSFDIVESIFSLIIPLKFNIFESSFVRV
jgi:hypothetical protein